MIRDLVAGAVAAVVIVMLAAAVLWSMPVQAEECVVASWYGPGFHGKRTASGERFDQNAMTAAMPGRAYLGRHYRVTRGGKSVDVRVNDVGPAKRTGRGIDLSKGAAARLGMSDAGVGSVCLTRLR